MSDDLHAAFWHSIALVALSVAPNALRKTWLEMGAVAPERTIRELQEWNSGALNYLHMQSMSHIYRSYGGIN